MNKSELTQRNIGMYSEQWAWVDALTELRRDTSSAVTVRFLVEFHRAMVKIPDLARAYIARKITADEFASQAVLLILSNGDALPLPLNADGDGSERKDGER